MKKILIVDDEIDLCMMIKVFLTKKNYEVHTAHSLREGYKKLNAVLPDTLLLDNNLPDGMGWKEADNIHTQFPNMNITLISAYQTSREIKGQLNYMVNILEKPISLIDIEQYL